MEYGQYKATSNPRQYPREAYRFKPSETSVQLRADESQVDPGAAATRPVPAKMEDVMPDNEENEMCEACEMRPVVEEVGDRKLCDYCASDYKSTKLLNAEPY